MANQIYFETYWGQGNSPTSISDTLPLGVLPSLPSPAKWGEITGDITLQVDLETSLNLKQDKLVSATNIKTINGNSLLGSGDLVIQDGSSSDTKIVIITGNTYVATAVDLTNLKTIYFFSTRVANVDRSLDLTVFVDDIKAGGSPKLVEIINFGVNSNVNNPNQTFTIGIGFSAVFNPVMAQSYTRQLVTFSATAPNVYILGY